MHSGKKGVNYLARKFANILGGPLSDVTVEKRVLIFATVLRESTLPKTLSFEIHIEL